MGEHEVFSQLPPPFNEKVDAAMMIHSALCWLFSGGLVVMYDTDHRHTQRLKEGPVPIKEHEVFSQLPPPFNEKVDAAMMIHSAWCVLFSGGLVVMYDTNRRHTQRLREG